MLYLVLGGVLTMGRITQLALALVSRSTIAFAHRVPVRRLSQRRQDAGDSGQVTRVIGSRFTSLDAALGASYPWRWMSRAAYMEWKAQSAKAKEATITADVTAARQERLGMRVTSQAPRSAMHPIAGT